MKKIRILKAVIDGSSNDINSLENAAHRLILDGYDLFASHTMRSEHYVYIVLIFEFYGEQDKKSEQVINNVYTEN